MIKRAKLLAAVAVLALPWPAATLAQTGPAAAMPGDAAAQAEDARLKAFLDDEFARDLLLLRHPAKKARTCGLLHCE